MSETSSSQHQRILLPPAFPRTTRLKDSNLSIRLFIQALLGGEQEPESDDNAGHCWFKLMTAIQVRSKQQ
jgi:hypothetical protein